MVQGLFPVTVVRVGVVEENNRGRIVGLFVYLFIMSRQFDRGDLLSLGLLLGTE